ncbi:hypothetical protein [Anatilimnocola floriformis]|uniref:hypothetical protein n=1 Tax=Anatilimnocola floriformis TaxID=2948575 RepID=UPI0020C436EF|nr:hypothetical protein [Anatilimnocola floriformis]
MKRESRAPLIFAIVLLLLPALYVGSYLALVLPEGVVHDTADPAVRVHGYYRLGGPTDLLYAPLESVDRKLRPNAWIDPIPGVSRYYHRSWGKWVSSLEQGQESPRKSGGGNELRTKRQPQIGRNFADSFLDHAPSTFTHTGFRESGDNGLARC